MLPNEETTRSELTTKPGELEALLAVAGREEARPLVAFLKEQRLNVTLVQDADSAFEEAVLHRPNLVVLHHNLPPSGGLEVCQRLKANTRTHFVPTIVFAPSGSTALRTQAFAAGADAVFCGGDAPDERGARLWALLRTQALYRRQEKKRESQGVALRERGQWLESFMHDLQNAVGALQANFEFLARAIGPAPTHTPVPTTVRASDLVECTSETQGLLRELAFGLRTLQDYERFESGRIGLKEVLFSPGELLHEVCAEVRIAAGASGEVGGPTISVDPTVSAVQTLATGDRDLLRRAFGGLVGLLKRRPGTKAIQLSLRRTDAGLAFLFASDGPPLSAAEQAHLFDPYATLPLSTPAPRGGVRANGKAAAAHLVPPMRKAPIAERFELGLARAIIELHRGKVQCRDADAPAGFLIELRSRDSLPKSH